MKAPVKGLAFVLIDGIGDISIPELGNRTPLEAAQCPNLDAIAGTASDPWTKKHPTPDSPDMPCDPPPQFAQQELCAPTAAGLNGQLDPVQPGLACGSDTAHLSIFGYDPRK